MAKLVRGNIAINGEKKLMLERLAVDVSYKAGRTITWTDIVHHMVDHYAKDAAQDLLHNVTNDSQKKT